MAVNIQGKGCCGVAKIFLHRLYIVTGADRRHGVRVAQIMEAFYRSAQLGREELVTLLP